MWDVGAMLIVFVYRAMSLCPSDIHWQRVDCIAYEGLNLSDHSLDELL